MVEKKDLLAARAAMAEWQDHRGFKPFGLPDQCAEDRAAPFLSQATSILSVLSAACNDMQTLRSQPGESELGLCHGSLLAGALDGVSTLVSLAAFQLED